MVSIWTEPAGTGRMHVSSRPHPKCCSLSCPSSTCMPLTALAPLILSSMCAPSTRSPGELTSITSRQWFCPLCCLLTTGSCGELLSCVILNKLSVFPSVYNCVKEKVQSKIWNLKCASRNAAVRFYAAFRFGFILSMCNVVFVFMTAIKLLMIHNI